MTRQGKARQDKIHTTKETDNKTKEQMPNATTKDSRRQEGGRAGGEQKN